MPSKAELSPSPNADFSGGGIFDPKDFEVELANTIASIYYYSLSDSESDSEKEFHFATVDDARNALNAAVVDFQQSRGTPQAKRQRITVEPDPDLKAKANIQRARRFLSSLELPKNNLDALTRDITIILSKSLQRESARAQAFADLERLAQLPVDESKEVPIEIREELADYRESMFSFHYPSPPKVLFNIGQNTSEAASRIIADRNRFYDYARFGSMLYVRRELGTIKKFYDTPDHILKVPLKKEGQRDFGWVLANLQGEVEFVLGQRGTTVVSLDELRRHFSDPLFNVLRRGKGVLELFFDLDDRKVFLEMTDERNSFLEELQSKVDQQRAITQQDQP